MGRRMVQSAFKGSVRLVVLLLLVATSGAAQTFDVNGQTSPTNQAPAKKRSTPQANNPTNNGTGMGWGASIEVAREARAAQTALQRGDAGDAALHAQRAVKAAP